MQQQCNGYQPARSWITVGIFVASVALFRQLLKRDRRAWTSLVAAVVLMEELTLSLWLLINDVQILSPHFMDGM